MPSLIALLGLLIHGDIKPVLTFTFCPEAVFLRPQAVSILTRGRTRPGQEQARPRRAACGPEQRASPLLPRFPSGPWRTEHSRA